MGRAASIAKDMPEEKMPHMTASSNPFFTSNSRTAEPRAISLRCPATDTVTMPQSATAMPNSVSRPPRVLTSWWAWPWISGGISVPTTRVTPMATPMPSDMPRYRMVRP